MKRLVCAVALLLAALYLGGCAETMDDNPVLATHGLYVQPNTFEGIMERADYIVRVRMLPQKEVFIEDGIEDPLIYRVTTLQLVHQYYGDEPLTGTIRLYELQGTSQHPYPFRAGDEYVLCASYYEEDDRFTLINPAQGIYVIEGKNIVPLPDNEVAFDESLLA